jgi:transcriptional regulator with XRE-family HTH domain
MKVQRQVLEITQAKLAEKVSTSTHYIGMIESEKKFPTPEMLERIAAALEIDAPALFSLKSYPATEAGTIAKFQEQLLNDIAQVITPCKRIGMEYTAKIGLFTPNSLRIYRFAAIFKLIAYHTEYFNQFGIKVFSAVFLD